MQRLQPPFLESLQHAPSYLKMLLCLADPAAQQGIKVCSAAIRARIGAG